ncbi:Coagulation factor X [Araneus ventricosus]|uniref:limulus clotting factor C n=1 Tax=Araneus ventricosus TaxID=182803 RepID=A0A4Y2J5G4_ARAVE|nr:Coagulation factor X [Araneus ventricosus]
MGKGNCHKCQKREPGNLNKRRTKDKPWKEEEHKIYSKWSNWSPCDSSCYTKRIKKCVVPGKCNGRPPIKEYRECYVGGDECEKRYLERNLRNSTSQEFFKQILKDDEHPLDNITCGVSKVPGDSRIRGGRRVVKGSWPWQVVVLNALNEALCGGVILSERWILTAAHCARHNLKVRAGEHDLSRKEGTEQEYSVADVFAYEGYDTWTVEGDIALLKMESPFQFNHYVQPICLPAEGEEILPHDRATILGWGRRRNDTNYGADVLHQADVPIVPAAKCRAAYRQYVISDKMLCAGFDSGKVDSCRGDSGGPLMDKRPDGTWAIYGVTSFGDGCGEERKYGVYASVPAHLGWIKAIIKQVEAMELATTETPTEQTTLLGSQEEENFEMY